MEGVKEILKKGSSQVSSSLAVSESTRNVWTEEVSYRLGLKQVFSQG